MDDIILNVKAMAIESYESNAEVVSIHDVLKEDLQTVEIVVSCMTRVCLPKNMSEAEAIAEATKMYKDGLVLVEPDECDEMIFKCELVKEENSKRMEG
jgi:hypothetical protein